MPNVLRYPLFALRLWLYLLTIFLALFLVLLPASVAAYSFFYSILVPEALVIVPLLFSPPDLNPQPGSAGQTLQPIEWDSGLIDPTITYDAVYNIVVICRTDGPKSFIYSIDALDVKDTAILHCDEPYVYAGNNKYIPYNLKYFVPPILVDWSLSSNVRFKVEKLDANKLQLLRFSPLTLQRQYLLDGANSYLKLEVRWTGFKYYLANYSVTSFIVGVLFFWLVSSFTCLSVTVYIFGSNREGLKPDVKAKANPSIKSEARQGINDAIHTNASFGDDSHNLEKEAKRELDPAIKQEQLKQEQFKNVKAEP